MKKQYISPCVDFAASYCLVQMVCTSTKGNWGKGNYDNEGYKEDEGIPDDGGEIDAGAKGSNIWEEW